MKWIETLLRNKLIVYVLTAALCLLGFFSLFTRPISPFPAVTGNDISIQLAYPGANAQTVQKQITREVVNRLQAIPNVNYITANSQAGAAQIYMDLSTESADEILQSQMDVNRAISAAHLPSSVSQPQITLDAGRSGLISFTVTSKLLNLFAIDNFVQSILVPKFSALPGVIVNNTSLNPVIKIKLKPEAMARYQLSPGDVAQTLNKNYQSTPLGSLLIHEQEYMLNLSNTYNTLPALKRLLVGYKSGDIGMPIYLKDVATVSFEPRNIAEQPYNTFNGRTSGVINLQTRTRANPFYISAATRAQVKQLQSSLPADMKITPVFDMAKIMLSSMKEVSFTIIFASFLVLLVALIFLGRLRTTLIPIVTIPICLLGAVVCISILGFSINILTLLAMVIGVGLVVDDAIVVTENITRYSEQGMKMHEAILHGTANIAITIIGITLTLIAVYTPILFLGSDISQLLKPFALTLASAVLISGIVALTLTPIMSSGLMVSAQPNRYQIRFEKVLHKIIALYQSGLRQVFNFPLFSLLIVIALIGAGGFYASKLPVQMFPHDPSGSISITVTGTPTDNVPSLKAKLAEFNQFYRGKTIEYYSLSVDKDPQTGILTARANIQYKPPYLTKIPSFALTINQFINTHHMKNTFAKASDFSSWGGDYDLDFYVYGGSDFDAVNARAKLITKLMNQSPIFSTVNNMINEPQKQLAFKIDIVKADRLGISRDQISQMLSIYYGGTTMNNYFSISGMSLPIVMQINNNDLKNPKSFEKLLIKSPIDNKFYPLANFVTLKTIAKPLMVTTFNNQPAVEFLANLNKAYTMNDAINWTNKNVHNVAPGLQLRYVGKAKHYLRGNKETILIATLGIAAIYFLLTILFRSLLDPFIIMLTVPFSVIGGALSLYLINGSINIYSTLGLITLVGLITKHGVLIVKFANSELKKGVSVLEAILIATHHRFRPIIMTTLAMVFGAFPLVFSSEIMYVSRQSLGIVIVGGLIIGTFFSLFIVPLVYLLLKRRVVL